MRTAHLSVFAFSLSLVASGALGCSSSSTPAATGDGGAGAGGGGGGGGGAGMVTQKGTIVDFTSGHGVPGATVTALSATAMTGADGSYSLSLPKDTPFEMSVAGTNYIPLAEQEWKLSADYDRGPTKFLGKTLFALLSSSISDRDPAKGIVSVLLMPTGSCADEGGATIAVSPAGSAKVLYFNGALISQSATTTTKGSFPSAVAYNVAIGVPVTFTVTGGSCKPIPFPYTDGSITYTGNVQAAAGDTAAFSRVFLK